MKFTIKTPINALIALIKVIKNILLRKPVLVDDETYAERLATCLTCDNFVQETSQCELCTCIVYAKARLTSEQCPLSKWRK